MTAYNVQVKSKLVQIATKTNKVWDIHSPIPLQIIYEKWDIIPEDVFIFSIRTEYDIEKTDNIDIIQYELNNGRGYADAEFAIYYNHPWFPFITFETFYSGRFFSNRIENLRINRFIKIIGFKT
jgi:hypothetical protein